MTREGADYGDALARAQDLGYAEPDPANDVEGEDARYKLAILASLAFHTSVRPEDISATVFHLLGIEPHSEVRDALNRPLPISGGSVIDGILV